MNFEITLGLYPGILFGVRSYVEQTFTQYVLYVPFFDICVTIYNGQDESTD